MSPPGEPEGGINGHFVGTDDTLVSRMRWNQLAATRAIIGRCRACGGDVQAIEPTEHDAQGETGQVTWYEMKCRVCGRESAAPNGRIMRRSGAHRETPRGWLEARESRDEEEVKQRAGYTPDGHPPGRRSRR
jgi:hypothetical protein